MAMNRDFIGRTYPESEPYEVGREKIREFADAIGDPNPAYRDADAAKALGHPDIVAPPTFPYVVSIRVLRQAVADPDLGLDYGAMVHGEQRFSYARPVYPGDVLTGKLSIEDIRTVGRNEMLTTRVDFLTSKGEQVCTSSTTLVVRGGAESQED